MQEENTNYIKSNPDELWWCNSHEREATYIFVPHNRHCCDPKLAGILLPCVCVNLSGKAEIENARRTH